MKKPVFTYSMTAVFLSTIVCCSVRGESNYKSPVVDIHYDSNGQTVSPDPLAYNTAPEAGYSVPPSENGYESLRTFGTGSSNSFVQKRLFNTSVALTVPLFSFTLPQKATQGDTVDLANQAIFGLFSMLVIVLVFAVPILFTGTRPVITGRSNVGDDSSLNHLMNADHVFNLMGVDMKNRIGIDPAKCLQKTICEAHRYPKKYGLLATPFQIFFPPPSEKVPTSRATSYQLAAKDGKMTKKDCGKNYKCFFDVLDLAMYLIDWWQYKNNPTEYQ